MQMTGLQNPNLTEVNMALEVAIFPKNMELTDRISEYVTKKISKLDRYLSDIEETRVDLAYQKSARNPSDRQVAQITIRGRGYILRTEERSDDIFSVDMALEKMQRKIERLKGKRVRGRGDGTPTRSDARSCSGIDDDEEESPSLPAAKLSTWSRWMKWKQSSR
jgi:putative sigma-54 modulation protein